MFRDRLIYIFAQKTRGLLVHSALPSTRLRRRPRSGLVTLACRRRRSSGQTTEGSTKGSVPESLLTISTSPDPKVPSSPPLLRSALNIVNRPHPPIRRLAERRSDRVRRHAARWVSSACLGGDEALHWGIGRSRGLRGPAAFRGRGREPVDDASRGRGAGGRLWGLVGRI